MSDHNNIIFIGAVADSYMVKQLNAMGCNVSTACNVQNKMLEGLEELGIYADTISGYPAPSKGMRWQKMEYNIRNRNASVEDVVVPYRNIPLIEKVIKGIKIGKIARKWTTYRKKNIVFTYSLNSSYLMGAVAAKRHNPGCKLVAIIPDLPEYMSNNRSTIYRLLKKIDRVGINRRLKEYDGFILFADAMKERLPVGGKPYTVIEGIIRKVEKKEYLSRVDAKAKERNKIIMLSGNLDYEEGVMDLLDAFEKIEDPEYKLWLTGDGNASKEIRERAKKDNRIHYWGYIDSYEKFLELQQQAFVFALMVRPQNEKTPYYFPSKIMEYLVAGGLVVCHKLRCLPSEYDDILEYFPQGEGGITRKLMELCELDSHVYMERATRRYAFLETKYPCAQMEKAVELIHELG